MAKEVLVVGGWAGRQYVPNLWIHYKITLEGFNKLWTVQDGKCAGCKGQLAHPLTKDVIFAKRPEVDHDHETGKVRGLLCRGCNDFLGKIKDNKELLQNLIEYLIRNGDW